MNQLRNELLNHDLELGVSRETLVRLRQFEEILLVWQKKMNLVSRMTVQYAWERHIVDSLALRKYASDANTWVDIGSGGGFPGIPLAICSAGNRDFKMHLVERDHRKCAFLREASRITQAPALVHNEDIVDVLPKLGNVDVFTSRAVAPVGEILSWVGASIRDGATGLFMKGREPDDSLTEPSISSMYMVEIFDNETKSGGQIVKVSSR